MPARLSLFLNLEMTNCIIVSFLRMIFNQEFVFESSGSEQLMITGGPGMVPGMQAQGGMMGMPPQQPYGYQPGYGM